MTIKSKAIALFLLIWVTLHCVHAQTNPPLAPLFEDLGEHHHEVSTDNAEAQEYFNQGLILHYGFNHAEAVRSFQQAQRLDPDCAMAWWGEALSLGPHINAGMSHAAVTQAWNAIQTALDKSHLASDKEQDYINALARRYQESSHPASLDQAWADAMREVAGKYPDDADAQALFAEALMVTTPWDYWLTDGSPNETTREILSVLETSMEKEPNHPGTNHFYIHTVETRHPERGEGAADRLRDLVPQTGHLQHMPSHIYIQTGRYADASLANEKAVAADREYLDEYGAHGMYRISYMPHNSIYLCFTTSMEGRGQACLEAAKTTRELILEDPLYQPGYGSLTQGYALRYVAMARFGMWDKMLREARPPEELPYPTAIWHYARGMALLRTGETKDAQTQLQHLHDMTAEQEIARMDARGPATTRRVLQIAANMLAGEIAAAAGEYDEAVASLRKAVDLQDRMGYYEPPPWFAPPRQTLGAILLESGDAAAAEEIFREDLMNWPDNGWSLSGLYQSLEAQGRDGEAGQVRNRFENAWSRADVELRISRM